MHTARFKFKIDTLETTSDFALDLLSCLYKNGQIVGNSWPMALADEWLETTVTVPDAAALDLESNNRYVNDSLAKAQLEGLRPPDIEIVGMDPTSHTVCACENLDRLVLFTTYMSEAPPLRCLACFHVVPLYRIPHIHDDEHLCILHWEADYQACDTLQMHCTTGERFGEDQLADHDSSLSRNGRDICEKLEAIMGIPIYYYLHRMKGRSLEEERGRPCPSCHQPWKLSERTHLFDFKCDPCRLLSAVPSSIE